MLQTYHDNVGVEILTDVNIALHDGVEGGDVDSAGLETENGRLEEGLGGTETLVADGDDLTIGKLVGLLEGRALAGGLDLLLEVEGDVAQLLLDVTDNFTLRSGGEWVATFHQVLDKEFGKVTTGKVETEDGVRKRETYECISLLSIRRR